jgi:hypothetical protein
MAILFKESPDHESIGREAGRCVISGVQCKPPYVSWFVPGEGNLSIDGRAVTLSNVCEHIADVIACRGPWAKLTKPEPGLCADLLALAYAGNGGLLHHSAVGQHLRKVPAKPKKRAAS